MHLLLQQQGDGRDSTNSAGFTIPPSPFEVVVQPDHSRDDGHLDGDERVSSTRG